MHLIHQAVRIWDAHAQLERQRPRIKYALVSLATLGRRDAKQQLQEGGRELMVSPVVHGRQDTYAGNCMPFSHNSPRSVCAKTQVLLIVQKTPCFTSCDTAALLGLSLYLGVLLRPQKNAYPPSFQPLNIHIVLHPENIGSALSVHKPLKTWNPGPLTSWDNRCNTSNHLQGKMRTCFGQHKHITRSSSRYDAANATSRESSRWCSLSDGSF